MKILKMKKYQKQVKIPYWFAPAGGNKLINPLIVSYGTSISDIVGIKETIATRIREMFIKTALEV